MTRWLGFSAIGLAGSALVVAPMVGGTFTADAAVAGLGFVVYSVMGGLLSNAAMATHRVASRPRRAGDSREVLSPGVGEWISPAGLR